MYREEPLVGRGNQSLVLDILSLRHLRSDAKGAGKCESAARGLGLEFRGCGGGRVPV